MELFDVLYGRVSIPGWLEPLIFTPEVQRLRDIRLINISSPTCASLSDVRRFGHTLGVVTLALRLFPKVASVWSSKHARSFVTAALLHDIGTPAFGHLFEYLLSSEYSWHHEVAVKGIIKGTYRPEKRYHQIYFSNPLRLHERLKDVRDIDLDLVFQTITGQGPLGGLLAGVLDVDNIDNVFRMAAALGLKTENRSGIGIIDGMILASDGITYTDEAVRAIDEWRDLRRRIYRILVFDRHCVSGQAMLSEGLALAMRQGVLGEEHWYLTDDAVLQKLMQVSQAKDIIRRFGIGEIFDVLFMGWYHQPKGDIDYRNPAIRSNLQTRLTKSTGVPLLSYVFYDRGTFCKPLEIDTVSGRIWLGEESRSTVVTVCTPNRLEPHAIDVARRVIIDELAVMGFKQEVLQVVEKEDSGDLYSQGELPF